MSAPFLQNLLDLGDKLKDALEKGEMDTYFDVLDERGTLLDAILAYRHPSELDTDWKTTASALAHQNDALMEAAELQRRRMQNEMIRIEQVKEAQRSYAQLTAPPNILNENLRV